MEDDFPESREQRDKKCDEFWEDLEGKGDQKLEDLAKEMVTVPRTFRGPLTWHPEDDQAFGEGTPEPLSREESQRRVDHVLEECKRIRSKNRRADFFYFKTLHGFRLLEFDRQPEEDQKQILDIRHASSDDVAYRKHRMALHNEDVKANKHIKRLRQDLATYLRLSSNVELEQDEQVQMESVYEWLLYNLQFDSLKWLSIPRTYNRKAVLLEVVVKLFIETWFACTILDGKQIQSWFAKGLDHWKLIVDKQCIFIMITEQMPLVFWDLLYEQIQMLRSNRRSVIVVSHDHPSEHIPASMKKEFWFAMQPHNKTFLENAKIDRETYRFLFTVPERNMETT